MSNSLVQPPPAVLVIGYGNELRGDDAAGPRAASAVAGLRLPGVIALAVPQLTPELAEPLALAQLAIFIDACPGDDAQQVEIQPLAPEQESAIFGHVQDPRRLLALARMVYGRCPRSCLFTIPATDVSLGRGLSLKTERALDEALPRIVSLAVNFLSGAGRIPDGLLTWWSEEY